MSMSLNSVNVSGRLTRDIELRHTPSGTAVTDISLALNDRRKQGEEWVDVVSFIDVTLFGRTAEVAATYLSKGKEVIVSGRLKQETWEDRDSGAKRSKVKVICEKLIMTGDKSDGGGERQSPQSSQYVPSAGEHEDTPF